MRLIVRSKSGAKFWTSVLKKCDATHLQVLTTALAFRVESATELANLHSNQVSVVRGLRFRETRLRGPETKAPKRAPKSNWPIVETERLPESPPIRGYS